MALPGELAGTQGATCTCGEEMELEVLKSAAGNYLGYFCPNCGPYSRETVYFPNHKAAKEQLQLIQAGLTSAYERS